MNLINDLALIDLDLQGVDFTWSNHRLRKQFFQVRLDRSLITMDWLINYTCTPSTMARIGFDHSLIILVMEHSYV